MVVGGRHGPERAAADEPAVTEPITLTDPDGAVTRVAPWSSWTREQTRAPGGEPALVTRLERGQLWFSAGRKRSPWRHEVLVGPATVSTPRGRFQVTAEPDGGATIACLAGRTRVVTGLREPVLLGPDQSAAVSSDGRTLVVMDRNNLADAGLFGDEGSLGDPSEASGDGDPGGSGVAGGAAIAVGAALPGAGDDGGEGRGSGGGSGGGSDGGAGGGGGGRPGAGPDGGDGGAPSPWYRRGAEMAAVAALLAVLIAAVIVFGGGSDDGDVGGRDSTTSTSASSTSTTSTSTTSTTSAPTTSTTTTSSQPLVKPGTAEGLLDGCRRSDVGVDAEVVITHLSGGPGRFTAEVGLTDDAGKVLARGRATSGTIAVGGSETVIVSVAVTGEVSGACELLGVTPA